MLSITPSKLNHKNELKQKYPTKIVYKEIICFTKITGNTKIEHK